MGSGELLFLAQPILEFVTWTHHKKKKKSLENKNIYGLKITCKVLIRRTKLMNQSTIEKATNINVFEKSNYLVKLFSKKYLLSVTLSVYCITT